ncbi:MAG: deoxyribose-phosphate aldolase [Sedimentisphaerales bacterium]|nr:deoxyribose-phosphate aldolase [Sedimentisphaerales bacterium]
MTSSSLTAAQLAAYIDHTLLAPHAVPADIERLCQEAIQYNFAAVCIHPCHLPQAVQLLQKHPTRIGTVVGFPFGTNTTEIKAAEARQAIDQGAQEIDMVVNLSAALTNNQQYLARDISAVLAPCRAANPTVTLKIILETAVLPTDVKIMLCKLGADLAVDYLKTSTGLHPAGGATLEDVALLYQHRGSCKVKAAGGIRTADQARAMIQAGASRIGTSAGVTIVTTCN